MKIAWSLLLLAAALTVDGCATTPPPARGDKPGGPGAPAQQTVYGPADNSFNLSLESNSLRQGDRKSVTVAIYRNVNFKGDVTLGFGDLPKGLSIDPGSPVIKRDDTEAHFTLTAADDASIGDFSIRVTGHPSKGPDASNDFNVTVDKK